MRERGVLDVLLAQTRAETLIWGAVALAALLCVGGGLYLAKPALAELREVRDQLAGVTASLDAERRAVDTVAIEKLENSIAEKRELLYGASAGIDRRETEAQVIAVLDRSARRHDVRLASVHPGQPRQVVMFDELPFDVEVSGEYFALFEWFRASEVELRPLVVKHFAIRRSSDRELEMKLRLVAYRAEEGRS